MTTHSRIPILLLTGFLGSGKTTLLNRLMAARPESRGKLAIVVNEFGEVGIDGDLLPSDMTRQVELPGGCICCVLNEDLDKTLCELLDTNDDIELIVIETTGVAEPLPIAWTLDREPLSERVRLAAVITVVDVLEFERSRPASVAVDAQVEYADILVLSKLDLTQSAALSDDLATTIHTLNPDALRIQGSQSTIVSVLWQAVADPVLSDEQTVRAATHGAGKAEISHDHSAQAGPPHGFESVALKIEKTIDFEELSSMLEALPGNYIRIKGIALAIDESTGSSEPRWIAFHRVGTRVSYEPLSSPSAMRMVALGRDMDPDRLAACLDASMVPCK